MKKDFFKIVFLLTCFVFVFSMNSLAVEIIDISEEDPVYDTVEELVEQGVMNLTEEGEFSGEATVTHYQLAEIIEGILAKIETGQIQISEEEIRELSLNLREDVSELNTKQQEILEIIEHMVRENVVFKEELGRYEELTMDFEEDIAYFSEEIEIFSERIDNTEEIALGFEDELEALKEHQANLESILTQVEDSQEDIKDYLDLSEEDLRTQVQELENKIADIESLYDDVANNLQVLNEEFSSLDDRIDDEQLAQIEKIEADFRNRLIEIQDEYSLELTALQTRLNSRINELRETNEQQQKEIEELRSSNNTLQLFVVGVGAISVLALIL